MLCFPSAIGVKNCSFPVKYPGKGFTFRQLSELKTKAFVVN